MRLVFTELLLEYGFRVIEGANAAEALTVLESGLPVDVVLTDVDMPPGLDGFALARRIRERWPAVEVLVTSGRQWPGDGDLPEGVAFLAKPCPNHALVLHVASAAERARAAQAAAGPTAAVPLPRTA